MKEFKTEAITENLHAVLGFIDEQLELFGIDERLQRAVLQQVQQRSSIRIIVFRKECDALNKLRDQRPDQKNHGQQCRYNAQSHGEIPARIPGSSVQKENS